MDIDLIPFEHTQQFHDTVSAAHEFLLNRIEDQRLDIASWSHSTAVTYVGIETATFVQEWRIPINESEVQKVATALLKELTGYGPLDDLLSDPEVEDILVNGYQDVYVSRRGVLKREPVRFSDNRHVLRTVRRILAPLGRRLDEANPMVDARMANGGRLNAIIEPLAVSGPSVSIRKFRQDPFTPDELMANGAFDHCMRALLQAAVESRCNILISGGTSSGKTSLLNALASYIPLNERVITIEDTAELSLNHPHVVRLESRVGGFDGSGAVSTRDLLRNSLRMRPDRIVVGEVRGAEVLEMLQAMNTGHDGSMSTIHANSPRDALSRLEMLAGFAGFKGTEDSLRRQVASAIDFVIQIARLSNGHRVISSVTEITGLTDKIITTQEMFRHETFIDVNGSERNRWPALGFHPHTRKLEPFREFLQRASLEAIG
ncbi:MULTISPECIES: CpaF family protein [unclassified Rhodanobacter]|jgi:pilus assembly protein CpaF|uniref:CpaF family protein n=1 Tax=unclassified Rhodanobacter TaxID=2621553 RepID=UPI00182A5B3E|nr:MULTISPECIES: CpaF family protein [unclassified Rhodanobacter]MBB6241652.1 pilus assembly protein CpaF [Rhodanobacter sp. MP1X3]MBB6249360.1 pilus assembly protein CpaF [Rhodanobacter sp. A1T4]